MDIKKRPRKFGGEGGFASLEFAILMVFTVFAIATFANILLVENMRNSALTSLHDAARAGTRVVDIQKGDPTGEGAQACKETLVSSMHDLAPALQPEGLTCVIKQNTNGHYYMQASVDTTSAESVYLLPWASIFKSRLQNLSATYYPTEAAKP